LIGSAVISTGLVWRLAAPRRDRRSCFAALMLIATGWSLSNALEMAGADLATKLFGLTFNT
jgi:hypothetical protein